MARRGTEKWREQEWGDACATAKITIDWIKADPSYGQKLVRLTVDRRAVPAFRALAEVFVRWRYVIDPTQTGAFNCRHIGSDPKKPWSSHAWATAVDVNWQQNPDGSRLVTNMPQGMLDEIDVIVCADGTPVWRWGGDWDRDPSTSESYYDAMHFELWSTPSEIEAGPIVDPAAGGRLMMKGPCYYFEGADGMTAAAYMATDVSRGFATAAAGEAREAAAAGIVVIAVGGPAGKTLTAAKVPHKLVKGADRKATYRAVAGM